MYRKNEIKIVLRRTSQIFFIFLFFFRLSSLEFPLNEKLSFNLFFRFDGLLAIFTTISSLQLTYYFIPAFILLVLILCFGNFFCFWICPFGGVIDWTNILLRRKKWKFCIKVPFYLKRVRFFILGGFFLIAFLTIFFKIPHFLWVSDPYVIFTRAIVLKKWWLLSFLIIVALSVFLPRIWCNNICPLGALNYLFGVKLRYFIKRSLKKK